MTVLGYEIGSIKCEAAFVADFDIDATIPIEGVVTKMNSDRQTMAVRDGMIMKYTPLRFDPATGAHQIGGRYLFKTVQQMYDYIRFTSEDLEFEPGVKFWERSFFSNIRRQAWHVIGAHSFAPLELHYASRVERFVLSSNSTLAKLTAAWPVLCHAAAEEGLAAVWLLIDPDEQHVAVLTAVCKHKGETEADRASLTVSALERQPSLSRHLDWQVESAPLFDRTSLNLAIWLPLSDYLGGEACLFPTYPVQPRPRTT